MSKPASSTGTTGSLSSGREPFWRKSKPSLLAEQYETGVESPDDSRSMPTAVFTTVKVLGIIVACIAIVGVALWVMVGITVMPITKIGDNTWVVKWAAWPQGEAPQKSYIAVNSDGVKRDLASRFNFLVDSNKNASVQVVIAGPTGKVVSDPATGSILWNGNDTGFTTKTPIPETPLGENYLAVCVEGTCGVPGSISQVPQDIVMGEALGLYGFPLSVKDAPQYKANGM